MSDNITFGARLLAGNPYVRMIRDLQYWYARKEGNDGTSLYTALLLVSVLLAVDVLSLTWLADIAFHGKQRNVHWTRPAMLLLMAAVFCFHFVLSRVAGLRNHVNVLPSMTFPAGAKVYIALTATLVGASLGAIALTRS
jgi:hypothetical protein